MHTISRSGASLTLVCLFLSGCSPPPAPQDEPVTQNLYELSQAYSAFLDGRKRPPNQEELDQQLVHMFEGGMGRAPEKVSISPRDGKPIVVILGAKWDTDQRNTIWAYEQEGAEGKRYAMMLSRDVRLVPDEDFARAQFANGHKPDKP